MRTRTFLLVGLLAALLIAGGASYYASTHPDGLEYVAERVGFADVAEDSPTAGSPLSDYQVEGVENDAASGALAGVVGALVVLVIAGGLAHLVRRRGPVDPGTDRSGPAAEDHSAEAVEQPGRS